MQLMPRKNRHQQAITLRDAMNQLFEESFWDPFSLLDSQHLPAVRNQFMPNVDISETKKQVEVVADVPGYDKKDLAVNVEDGVLTIQGTMQEEKEEKDTEKRYYCKQCSSGSFCQRIAMPAGTQEEHATCTIKDGKLRVIIPKKKQEEQKGRNIPIDVQ